MVSNYRQARYSYEEDGGNNLYYIYLTPFTGTKVAKTVQVSDSLLNNGVNLDLDEEGRLIGIELIFGPPLGKESPLMTGHDEQAA